MSGNGLVTCAIGVKFYILHKLYTRAHTLLLVINIKRFETMARPTRVFE